MKTKIIVVSTFLLLSLTASTFGQKRAVRKTVFTSLYTSLGRGCQEFDGENGSDGFSICRGPGRYQVRVYYSAAATHINAEIRGKDDNFPLAMLSLDFDQRKARVEWRLANGKPFAAILRVPTYGEPTGDDQYFGKVIGEALTVRGLKGFSNIDASINAKRPRANAEARAVADNAYAEGGDKPLKVTDLQKPG
jgi:hypothetical protein